MKVIVKLETTNEDMEPSEQARTLFQYAKKNGLRVEAICEEVVIILMALQGMSIRSKLIKRGIKRKSLLGVEV